MECLLSITCLRYINHCFLRKYLPKLKLFFLTSCCHKDRTLQVYKCLIRLMGLESVAPKPNTSRQRKGHKVYPYLLKMMSIIEPDQVRYSDITYILLAHGFVYLTAVLDWGSRYVLSWEVSVILDDDF
jgi:transposase InsO family protein